MFDSVFRNIRIPSSPRIWLPGMSTPATKRLHVLHGHSWMTNRDDEITWVEDGMAHNILHDEGELYLLVLGFNTGYGNSFPAVAPASLYLGLDNRASVAEADTLATVAAAEPAPAAYTRATIGTAGSGTYFFNLTQPGTYYQAGMNDPAAFTPNSGQNIGDVTQRFLCTGSATAQDTVGKLIASLPLNGGTGRTVNDGDTLNTNILIGLSEG